MKAKLLVSAFTLAGCSSLLGLGEFEDAPAGATGGQAGAAGAGGGAGDSGSDAAVAFECSELLDKDMISESDLSGKKLELKSVRVIRSRHTPGMVFAVASYVAGSGNFGVVVRTHREGGASPGTMQTAVFAGHFSIADGYADKDNLHLWGFHQDKVAKLSFKVNEMGVDPSFIPAPVDKPTPSECQGALGYPRQIAFEEGWTTDDYVVTCQNTAGTNRSVYLGGNGSLDQVTSGPIKDTDSPEYRVRGLRHDGDFLIALEDGQFAHGTPGSWKLEKVELAGSGELASMLGIFPHPNGGTLIVPARVNLQSWAASIYSGVFKKTEYAQLGDEKRYIETLQISGIENFPKLEHMAVGPASLVGAGVTVDDKHVRFLKADRSGNPIAFQQLTTPKNITDTSAADAVPIGPNGAFEAVVWSEASPPLIRLSKLVCQPKQ
ncbi:MAG: hypothetical protein HYZ29_17070 [Myxococcales bacterium]|nr:hypothetical protein [Myxococcales bacterium]